MSVVIEPANDSNYVENCIFIKTNELYRYHSRQSTKIIDNYQP